MTVLALHFRPTEDLHGYAVVFQQTSDGLASTDGMVTVNVVGSAKTGWKIGYASSSLTGDNAPTGDTALDPSGTTTIDLPLADALTTYKLEAIAWTDSGWLTTATGEVRESAFRLEARPGRDVEVEQIEAEALVDRDPFLRDPVLIWIDEEARLAHRATFCRAGSGARRWPHFFLVSRLVSASGPIAIGNLSRHSQGRVASMIIRELWPLTSGAMAGSSGPDQARLMMSSERSGSERVTTAHMTSLRSVTSMSSSTTMTMRPRYAPTRHIAATCPAWRECPA